MICTIFMVVNACTTTSENQLARVPHESPDSASDLIQASAISIYCALDCQECEDVTIMQRAAPRCRVHDWRKCCSAHSCQNTFDLTKM